MKKALLTFLTLLLFASCQKEEQTYPLQGHWLQIEHLMDYGSLDMLDITDSSTRYSWKKFYPPKEVALSYNDTIYLPDYHLNYSPIWKLDKDLLTVYDQDNLLDSIIYTRIRDNRYWKEEYLGPLKVSVNLSDWKVDYDFSREEITAHRPSGDLFMGYSKDKDLPYQVYIQINDVYIGLDGINQWLDTERDMLWKEDRAKLRVLIHADKDVPYSEIEKVLDVLKQDKEPFTVYLAGISEELQDLVYRKID